MVIDISTSYASPSRQTKHSRHWSLTRMLSGPVPGQRFQVVGRRLPEILQRGCRSQRTELAA
jgi:hypothetical protein